ncbi:hypothetical protein EPO33_04330 [Patescibacteria group bacterium]|nr:MAG: hypothetical protein EPO33_04330 [Patescibacteria group bacterium]
MHHYQKSNTQARTVAISEAIALIMQKQVTAGNLRQLAIAPDGEQVFLRWGEVADEASHDPVADEEIGNFLEVAWMETDGGKLHLAVESGLEHILAGSALGKGHPLTKLLGCVQSMLFMVADAHRTAGKYGCTALALRHGHKPVESFIGTTEGMHKISAGREWDIRNIRLLGSVGAIGTLGNRMVFTPVDEKGRILPENRWTEKADFGANLAFLSKTDLESGTVVVTREDFRYQKVDLTGLLTRNPKGDILVGPAKQGDGEYYIGHTTNKQFVSSIGRASNGTKEIRTYPRQGNPLPAGAQAAFSA